MSTIGRIKNKLILKFSKLLLIKRITRLKN